MGQIYPSLTTWDTTEFSQPLAAEGVVGPVQGYTDPDLALVLCLIALKFCG